MSTTATKPADGSAAPPAPEKTAEDPAAIKEAAEQRKLAGVQLLDNMFADVYFAKLSEFGIVPQSEEDCVRLLNIGLNIEKLSQHPAVKKAEAKQKGQTLLGFADDSLSAKLAEFGIQTNQNAPSGDADIDKLAEAYTGLPIVQDAVLAVYAEQ